jgi:uncharacterized membrane protein YdfJ with MMPL/SSD domain
LGRATWRGEDRGRGGERAPARLRAGHARRCTACYRPPLRLRELGQATGRIVTSAALLFAVAFGAFLTSKIIITKELGLGTAAAVLLDATIVRAMLVPALMRLLGRWNWWAPAPLRRLHDRLRPQLGEA